jgi:multisubunit Na+/H+ antiporter MnhF subunit
MTEWLWAAAVLAALLVPAAVVAARRTIADALVALEFASTAAALALLLLSEGTHRQSFADVALVLVATSLIGAVALIRFLDRAR